MAQLGVEGLLPADLELHPSAVAIAVVASIEVLILLVDSVRRALLPLVDTLGRRRRGAALFFIHVECGSAEPEGRGGSVEVAFEW
jgi:hypothetical protein